MISVTLLPNHYKSRERDGSKEDKRETEPAELLKQLNDEKSDWQDAESETGPDEQLEQRQACQARCWLPSREKPGYRTDRCERLAAESAEERKTKLQELRTNQHERLAAESAEENSPLNTGLFTNTGQFFPRGTPEYHGVFRSEGVF